MPRPMLPLLLVLLGGCDGSVPGAFELEPPDDTSVAIVRVVSTDGEHVVLRNLRDDLRADLGGWVLVNGQGIRLPIPPSTQIDPGDELRLDPGCDAAAEATVVACLDAEFLPDAGGSLRLLDAAGAEVTTATYGDPG